MVTCTARKIFNTFLNFNFFLKKKYWPLFRFLCLFYSKLLEALSNFKEKTGEKARFYTLLKLLKDTDNLEIKTNLVTFLRAIFVHAEIDQRVALREELSRLNLPDILAEIKKSTDNQDLDKQIGLFEEEKETDDETLKKRYAHVSSVKLEDMNSVFEGLTEATKKNSTNSYFKDLLQNLIALNPEDPKSAEQWVLASKIVRQISYSNKQVASVDLERLIKAVSAEAHDVLPLKAKISSSCDFLREI